MAESTLSELLQSQQELVDEAAEALPHSFSKCTYSLGPLKQNVYLCTTCPEVRGICAACSIACHTDHEQVELFSKRAFRCDCPTAGMNHPCGLHKTPEDANQEKVYGQNFKGDFCRCGRPYDAKTERETMIQCLACEDWFHESCLSLRQRPSSRESTPQPEENETPLPTTGVEPNGNENDDGVSEASSSGLPPPLISAEDYETLICASCVLKIPMLTRWAGTQGTLMVMRDRPDAPWKVFRGSISDQVDVMTSHDSTPSNAGTKRPLSPSLEPPEPKRVKGISQTSIRCFAPAPNPIAQRILASHDRDDNLGAGDLFLTEGWRERWCKCEQCLPALESFPFLLKDEELYEPPDDPDSGLSLEELGMRALQNLPRERAIDGIHAFNAMRDHLMTYLRPFAREGKVVGREDIQSFFDGLNESTKKGR